MRFKRYGKTLQLRIETTDDLRAVLDLDESFWVATSAPITVFRCNNDFITMLDNNSDGRINTREVKDAIKWMFNLLADDSEVSKGADALALDSIRNDTAKDILEVAEHIQHTLNLSDNKILRLQDVYTFLDYLRKQPMNGDGVITIAAAEDEETANYIKDVITCTGGTPDAGGEQGITAENINAFQNMVTEYLDWQEQASREVDNQSEKIFPFGDNTAVMYDVLLRGAKQVELFFALCRTIGFDAGAGELIGCSKPEHGKFDFTKQEDINRYLQCEPIAEPNQEGRFPLDTGTINPLYRKWVEDFCNIVLSRIMPDIPEFITEKEWNAVKSTFHLYGEYINARPEGAIGTLPKEKLLQYRNGKTAEAARQLIVNDKEITLLLDRTRTLHKLLLYHKYLMRFVNNFVSFAQLYSVDERAMFEVGSAVIDGRWFNMAIKVDNVAEHEKMAREGNIFVLYVDVTAEQSNKKFTVAIPVTSGTRGNLGVGKRGIFIDIDGNEYNAKVIKIIKNPISIMEGIVAPFVRLWDFIIGKIEGISGTSEKELQKKTDALLKTPSASGSGGISGGPAAVLVGLSVSAAAIGSSFAFITKTLSDLTATQILLGIAGAVLLVSIPVVLLAIIKLNKQDLSSLLEGCGWAINSRMRLSRAQRHQFTLRKPYPEGIKSIFIS